MPKRVTSLLLLSLLAAAYALPVRAGGMVCRMDQPAPTEPSTPAPACGACEAPDGGEAVALLSAGSCCRFAAPADLAPSPVLVGTAPKCGAGSEARDLSLVAPAPCAPGHGWTRASAPLETRARSSIPTTLTTPLRL